MDMKSIGEKVHNASGAVVLGLETLLGAVDVIRGELFESKKKNESLEKDVLRWRDVAKAKDEEIEVLKHEIENLKIKTVKKKF